MHFNDANKKLKVMCEGYQRSDLERNDKPLLRRNLWEKDKCVPL